MAETVPVGLSIRDQSYALDRLGPSLDEAERLGVDSVELPIFAMHLVVDGHIVGPRLERVADLCLGRRFGLTLHGSLGIDLMDVPERLPWHVAAARAEVEIAGRLGARTIVFHAGFERTDQPGGTAGALARQQEALSRLGELARAHHVTICLENVFSSGGKRRALLPSRVAAEVAAVAHDHVRATLDVSHAALECRARGVDLLDEIAVMAPLARHLHVHDSFGRPRDFWLLNESEALAFGVGDLHLPPGWGSTPWDVIADGLIFDDGLVANLELSPVYWLELEDAVAATRRIAGRLKTQAWQPR